MTNQTLITKDLATKKMHVGREFKAPVDKVWKAWTDKSILDKWWAPRPWRAETRSLDFKPGGRWMYNMVGPDGTGTWCRVDFKTIVPEKSFTGTSSFCDEQGIINTDFPQMHWLVEFKSTDTGTRMDVTITFDEKADLEKIVAMGFEAGFTMGLGNLDELLETVSV
jgi:uncharacterized protein YndB with AHSA1/START domain